MKKTLVTGASGFIGRHTLPLLLREGHEVHAVSFKEKPSSQGEVCWHQADLKDSSQIKKLISSIKPTHLLHFAWCAEPGKFWADPENKQWVRSSLELIKAFQAEDGKRIVVSGSCAEYDWTQNSFSDKADPGKPATLYGACKQEFQKKAEDFCNRFNLSLGWGRIFFLYGPHEHPARLVPSVVCSLLQNKPAKCSHGNQIRDLIFVEDVASGFVSLLQSEITGTVNIGAGKGIVLKDAIKTIGEKVGRSNLIRLDALPSPENEPPVLIAETQRLKEEVGWAPKFDLNSGLDQTIEWWKNNLKNRTA